MQLTSLFPRVGSRCSTFGILLLVPLLFAAQARAGQATLAWDANTAPAVAGYMVYYGPGSGNYSGKADAGLQTTYTVAALLDGQKYYYAVTAYDAGRAESPFSNEASATTVAGPAPVGTPTGAAAGGSTGGGCVSGKSAALDPILLLLLIAAAGLLWNRRQGSRKTPSGVKTAAHMPIALNVIHRSHSPKQAEILSEYQQ